MGLVYELAHGHEDVFLVDAEFPRIVQIVRKDVEEQLGIRRRVDVSMRLGIHELQECSGVDQVSVLWVENIRQYGPVSGDLGNKRLSSHEQT